MFYAESLLTKTGPLARVWLAANLERKLTKQNVLQSNIDNNVKDIIGTGQAPMALRLSGQLLLGVVRIYSKKAKYLVDDCSEALGRLKLTFRPGNVDLTANHSADPDALKVPDLITEQDLLADLPDPDEFLRDVNFGLGNDSTLLGNTQLLPDVQLTPSSQRHSKPAARLEEDDLGLNFDEDEPSIEVGRQAADARLDGPSMLEEDLGLDFGLDDTAALLEDSHMQGVENPASTPKQNPLARNSEGPTSALRFDATAVEEIDETEVQAAQRVKRRKVLQQDAITTLENRQIKQQQEDRSAITREPEMLPRDPVLLQLMQLQKSGALVSNLLGDGQMAGWAPELRGILSVEFITKVGDRKRKRDSGIADMETSSDRVTSSPRLDVPLEDQGYGGELDDWGRDLTVNNDLLPGDDTVANALAEDGPTEAPFDDTVAPLLHPEMSGPVSLGTKTAVAALRRHLAPGHKGSEPPTPSSRTRAEAKFSELCPTDKANRNDATKMFFELLVLGTKDAVKIEQERNKGLQGEIRVRGKRGLWGPWAEVDEAVGSTGPDMHDLTIEIGL